MKISEITLKRLVLLNSALVVLGIATLITLAIMFRPQVKVVVQTAINNITDNIGKSIVTVAEEHLKGADTIDIPVYHLSVKSDDLRKLEEISKEAVKEGVLLKPNKIRFQQPCH